MPIAVIDIPSPWIFFALLVVLLPYAYFLALAVSMAWFKARYDYNLRLTKFLTKGEEYEEGR